MTDDQQDQQEQFDDRGGGGGGGRFPVGPGGGGGGGGLFQLLPLLLGLFRGKGGIFILIVGALLYFFVFRGGGCNLSQLAGLATGGMLDPQQFAKAAVYEPLTDDNTKNPLPESVSLLRYAPARQNQGQQGSCVAWSSAYAAHTIAQAASSGENPNQTAFSPAFLYNQIGLDGCQGSYIIRAMEYMSKRGSVVMDKFPYTDQDCQRQPDRQLVEDAAQHRIHGFNRLTANEGTEQLNIRAIKEHLAKDAPVVIGMMVGQSFMQSMMGQEVWIPAAGDESQMGMGGHAMCVIGYDDRKYGGAFQIMNSWGPEWGVDGVAYVRYGDFKNYVREAYGVDPLPKQGVAANTPLNVEVGLMQVVYDGKKTVGKDYISLRTAGSNVFTTTSKVALGTRFKMEVKNTRECYVYVFGKDVDGSSYTLFPYPTKEDATKTKYSPFCGITGYRMFPRDKSMEPDSIGAKDLIAVVITRQPLDWYALNQRISQNPQQDYGQRLNNALGSAQNRKVRFATTGKGTMQFTFEGNNDDEVVACVVEINK